MPKVNKLVRGLLRSQIHVRLDAEWYARFEKMAEREEIPLADLARKLLKITAPLYERAGSLQMLRDQMSTVKAANRRRGN
jgi:hypothetical protein